MSSPRVLRTQAPFRHEYKRRPGGAWAKSWARAHRGGAKSNRACETIWHSPFVRQRPGIRPTQPHRPNAATFGKSAKSDTYSFLSVTRGDPGAPSSHSRTATRFVIRAPASTWRLSPHAEHVSERGRRASVTPMWPQGQATLISTVCPKIAPADTGAEVCTTRHEQRGARSCRKSDTPPARIGRPAHSKPRGRRPILARKRKEPPGASLRRGEKPEG
jgi:hypothetical protein